MLLRLNTSLIALWLTWEWVDSSFAVHYGWLDCIRLTFSQRKAIKWIIHISKSTLNHQNYCQTIFERLIILRTKKTKLSVQYQSALKIHMQETLYGLHMLYLRIHMYMPTHICTLIEISGKKRPWLWRKGGRSKRNKKEKRNIIIKL